MFKTTKFLVCAGLLAITAVSAMAQDTHYMYSTQNTNVYLNRLNWPSLTSRTSIQLYEYSSDGVRESPRCIEYYDGHIYVLFTYNGNPPAPVNIPPLPNEGFYTRLVKYDTNFNKIGEKFIRRLNPVDGKVMSLKPWQLAIGKTPGTATFEKIYVIGY